MNKARIGMLGPKGTNTYLASTCFADRFFSGKFEPEFRQTHREVLEGVRLGEFDYAVVPIENSTGGLVREVIDFWMTRNNDCRVIDEQWLAIEHCLLVTQGDLPRRDEIHTIVSHPEVFAQCRRKLCGMGFASAKLQPVSSTVAAAEFVRKNPGDIGIAAIASESVAKSLGLLRVWERNIQDIQENATRFHLITRADQVSVLYRQMKVDECNKVALLFKVEHEVGALANVLDFFRMLGVNVTSLHSIPVGIPGRYLFYAEVVAEGRSWIILENTLPHLVMEFHYLGHLMEHSSIMEV